MSTMEEVEETMSILKEHNNKVIIMQCTSNYPCNEEDVNLNVLHLYKEKFPWAEIGLSGHFMSDDGGIESGAVAVGATWLERHFTLDRTLRGTDQSASVEPEGLKNISKAVRNVVKALGKKQKSVLECEKSSRLKYKS